MGAQGTTTVNFGAFPGASDVTVAVTGQTGILATSLVEAWILPVATADHSADEHIVAPPRVYAGTIVAGTGFTIYAVCDDSLDGGDGLALDGRVSANSNNALVYGVWTVAWVWN